MNILVFDFYHRILTRFFFHIFIFKLRCKYVGEALYSSSPFLICIWCFRIPSLSIYSSPFLFLAVVEADPRNITQAHFSTFLISLLLSSFVHIPLHTFLVSDTVFLFYSFLRSRVAFLPPHSDIRAIFFSLSSFLFLSSHRSEDCRAISVGSNVTWRRYIASSLGSHYMYLRCMHIYRGAYTGTVYIR